MEDTQHQDRRALKPFALTLLVDALQLCVQAPMRVHHMHVNTILCHIHALVLDVLSR